MKSIRITMSASFLLAVFLLLGGCQPGDPSVAVTVAVDFGPANRTALEKTVAVPERSTVFEALRSAFPVVTSGR
ncbi:MAG: hypothetical protein ACREQW_25290 [Candidatus Binatia bacterium]